VKIVLSPDQTRQLFAWAASFVHSEVDEAAFPSGVRIVAELAPPFGAQAYAEYGVARFEIGAIEVEL